jgi:hypothetical protein
LLSSILIIITSIGLFFYWFRCTCRLILAQGNAEQAVKVASTIRLRFPQIQADLQTQPQTPTLDRLHQSLQNDYHLLTELLHQARGADSIERRLLTMDYHLMRIWYGLTRRHHRARASNALAEMAMILGNFAADIGAAA